VNTRTLLALLFPVAVAIAIAIAVPAIDLGGDGDSDEDGVETARPASTVDAAPATPTIVPLDPEVDARLDQIQIQPQDVAPDATLVTEENVNLALAANLFAGDPDASANLTGWGFQGARVWTYRAGNTNIVVTVQAYASAEGAADAFRSFTESISMIPATLQSNEQVTVKDVQHSTFDLPPLGDEAYGTFSRVSLESKAGVMAILESRAVVFRTGDAIVSMTSFPALDASQTIAAAQALAQRV
jgi:hypothetical protein